MTKLFKTVALATAALISTAALSHTATHRHHAMRGDSQAAALNRAQLAKMDGSGMAMASTGSMTNGAMPMAPPADTAPPTEQPPMPMATPQPQ